MNGRLVDLGITQDALGSEEILAELLKAGTSDGCVEVDALEE